MKKSIFFLLIFITFANIYPQISRSNYQRYFQDSTGYPVINALVQICPQDNNYPEGAMMLISNRQGWYYRNNVPNGEYKIYINSNIFKEHIFIGDYRLQEILEKFNGKYQIDSSAIGDSVLTDKLFKVTSLSKLSKDLGSINKGTITGVRIQTDTIGQRIVIDSSKVTIYGSSGLAGTIYGYDQWMAFKSGPRGIMTFLNSDGNSYMCFDDEQGKFSFRFPVAFESSLSIADTSKIPNLNADRLDGFDHSEFAHNLVISSNTLQLTNDSGEQIGLTLPLYDVTVITALQIIGTGGGPYKLQYN
jgi:hypothetical protein